MLCVFILLLCSTFHSEFWDCVFLWLFISISISIYHIFYCILSVDADSSITELGHWLVGLKDIKFDMSSITKLVEFVKR